MYTSYIFLRWDYTYSLIYCVYSIGIQSIIVFEVFWTPVSGWDWWCVYDPDTGPLGTQKIAAVFYYLCVVTLQYVAPLILCLFFTLMYKTLGGYTWTGLFMDPPPPEECGLEAPPSMMPPILESAADASEQTIIESAQNFHLAVESLKSVFTTDVFRGLLGFATWWSCFTWFATTSMGMVYQSYFTKS